MIRILFLAKAATRGGTMRKLLHTLKLIDRERFAPRVALRGGGDLLPEYRRYAPTDVYEESRAWKLGRSLNALARRRDIPGVLRNAIRALVRGADRTAMRRWMRGLVSARRPDLIVHYYNSTVPLFEHIPASTCPALHTVTAYGSALDLSGDGDARRMIRRAQHFLVQGRVVREYLHDCLGVPVESISTGEIGVDLSRRSLELSATNRILRSELGIEEDAVIIGGCGSVVHWKGVDLWVRAAAILRDRHPALSLHFIWIGGRTEQLDQTYGCSIDRLVDELGLGDRVHLIGDQPLVYPWLDLCDIYVQPSRVDAFPHTVLEAMAVGKPVVSFPEGIAAEAYARNALLRADARTPECLADRVSELILDPTRRTELGAAGRALVEDSLTLEQSVRAFEDLVTRIIDGSGAAAGETAAASTDDARDGIVRTRTAADAPSRDRAGIPAGEPAADLEGTSSPDRVRVLFLAKEADRGGISRTLVNTLRLLDRGSFEPHVALLRGGSLVEEIRRLATTRVCSERGGSKAFRWIERGADATPGFVRSPVRKLARQFERVLGGRWIRSCLRDFDPDVVVHMNNFRVRRFDAVVKSGIPSIQRVSLYGECLSSAGEGTVRQLCKRADRFLTQGERVREYLHDCLGIPHEKISLIGAGIDANRRDSELAVEHRVRRSEIGLDVGDLVVGGCGHLTYIKGVDLWLRAAAILVERHPELPLRFLWIGGTSRQVESTYGKSVLRLRRHLGLMNRVVFVGGRSRVFPFLSLIDVFVMSSRTDSFPHAVLEAMSIGKPVVSYTEGLAAERSARDALVPVEVRTAEALADGIEPLLLAPSRRAELGEAGRALAQERLNLVDSIREFEAILLKTLEREQEGTPAE